MELVDNLQTKIERWSIYFQGGIRRFVLIFLGVCIILSAPFYFFGQFSSYLIGQINLNKGSIVNLKKEDVKDFQISKTQIVNLKNGSKDLYVSVNNRDNPNIGFSPWVYTIQVLDKSGAIISQETVRSFLLPGENTFVTTRNEDGQGEQIQIITEPSTNPVKYNPNNTKTIQPKIKIQSSSIINEEANSDLIVKAVLLNEDLNTVKSVNILYLIRDSRDSVIGIGTYSFNGFNPESERSFELTHPKPANREPKILDLRWSVNYLDPNNVTFE
jgi:hypothetical protein